MRIFAATNNQTMSKNNQKNSNKMTFKRWGTLVPQEHHRGHDFYEYHDAPVKMGIYAFPEKFASYQDVSGPCLSNGREYYIRDEEGKKVMMTKKEIHALETKERTKGMWKEHYVVSPKYLRGINTEDLYLDCEYFDYDDKEMDYAEAYHAWLEDEKRYPVMSVTDRLRTFSYGGNIWHHLEFTNNWYHWIRTDDGIKESMLWAYEMKENDENYDLEGALNSIITGQYEEKYRIDLKFDGKIKRLVKTEDIIRRSGSWILTNMRTYKKALEKAEHIAKYEEFMRLKAKGEVEGFPMGLPKREIQPTLFEVYIEKVE